MTDIQTCSVIDMMGSSYACYAMIFVQGTSNLRHGPWSEKQKSSQMQCPLISNSNSVAVLKYKCTVLSWEQEYKTQLNKHFEGSCELLRLNLLLMLTGC